MVVGIMQFELLVPWAESLKDKRRVVRSVKDRLHRQHLVSVAEVSHQEIHNVAVLGVAVVSETGARAASVLDRIEQKMRALPDAEFGDSWREIVSDQTGSLGEPDAIIEPKPAAEQTITAEDLAALEREIESAPEIRTPGVRRPTR